LIVYILTVIFYPVTVDASSIPSIVNGITTSTSIAIGLGAATTGIVFRADLEKGDYESRKTYIAALSLFILALTYPLGSYLFLINQKFISAVRYSLGGFLVALIGIGFIYVLIGKRWEMRKEKEKVIETEATSETEQEKLKREFQHRRL